MSSGLLTVCALVITKRAIGDRKAGADELSGRAACLEESTDTHYRGFVSFYGLREFSTASRYCSEQELR